MRNKRQRASIDETLSKYTRRGDLETALVLNTSMLTVVNALMAQREADMEIMTASNATDYVDAYYKVSRF